MQFGGFTDSHAATLRAMLDGPDWREAAASGAVEAARQSRIVPPPTRGVFALPVEQLVAAREEQVRGLVAAGERDEDRLLEVLGAWPAEWPEDLPVRLSFVGINLTFRCDMQPRCTYCNQRPVEERMTVEDWKALLRSLAPADGEGPYVSFTGGEPLLLGEDLWGPEGLIRVAAEARAACNLNTNALALTPRAALGLVSAGLKRVHISLDSHRPEVEDVIHQRQGRWAQIVAGLHNLQLAKALLGAEDPQIHINCVLTRLNADDLPGLLRFFLDRKPLVPGAISGDLDMHVIPVGGEDNRALRLTAAEYVRYFTETWARANEVWADYQAAREVPEENRGPLEAKVPFMSPFHRVAQRGSLEEWAERAAEGVTSCLALSPRCYVSPTQAFLLPNGEQYWCGGHAVSRPEPVGSLLEGGVMANLRRAVWQVAHLPREECRTCPGATMAINQTVEGGLRAKIREWLEPPAPQAEAAPSP